MEEATADIFFESMYEKCSKRIIPLDRIMNKADENALNNCFVRYFDAFRSFQHSVFGDNSAADARRRGEFKKAD